MKARECCDHACAQGRNCPLRTDRRAGPSLLWTLVSWFVPDRRSGKDRRVDACAPNQATWRAK